MPDKLLPDLEKVSQLLEIDFWKWIPELFQAIFPDKGEVTMLILSTSVDTILPVMGWWELLDDILNSCQLLVLREAWHCFLQGYKQTVHPGCGLRGKGRGIRRVTRDTLSQRECSLVTLQSYWKKFLCVPSTAEISCAAIPCFSTHAQMFRHGDQYLWERGIQGHRPPITNYRGDLGLYWFVLLCFLWSIFWFFSIFF